MVHQRRTTCRICGDTRLASFLSLGPMPLANSFLRSSEEFASEPHFPLDVCFCENCSLVQTPDVIDPEVLFRHYIYVTGTSDTIADHNRRYARTVVDRMSLTSDDLVVEVASNDGSLLRCFQAEGVKTLGIEPAANIAQQARRGGIETWDRFFNQTVAHEVRARYGPARVVVANNVLAHVDDTLDFLRGCRTLLADDGCVVIEVPYLRHLLDRLEYDTIYHEHLNYYSVTTLHRAFEAVGLVLFRVDEVPVHGGSLRVQARLPNHDEEDTANVDTLMEREQARGLNRLDTYRRFAADVESHRVTLTELLRALRHDGHTLAGYGAPAKGNTLLNYCGISTPILAFTVDLNPKKVNLLTPGMHIPVLNVEALLERQPDYVLILAWNFAEEIMRQQRTYHDRGGRFIIPVPQPRVIE